MFYDMNWPFSVLTFNFYRLEIRHENCLPLRAIGVHHDTDVRCQFGRSAIHNIESVIKQWKILLHSSDSTKMGTGKQRGASAQKTL